ncbi:MULTISPECIES: hypothetical protein [unclassified Lysobacter]|uniref:hypothetical protein n=1 Tax=unclassified Lysobacter TaxID=2635362 RepID=UPI001BED38A8|nr:MULTISPECIES: hypothetical protein [unclassified Lysobacter]MBT2745715.1 hypothetical protein [Lysobacter sp. ISL-42]MBT2749726.1 hypothetical protein [Lysobacter sp. ISL-50]MBT2777555.1 hypothetical protein [Lysobacter sp. ISL-54]MBT2782043.1 hypothetical protein [Lysobacter sp. ISL-52]
MATVTAHAVDRAVAPMWHFDHLNLQGPPDSTLMRLFGEVMGLRRRYRPPFRVPGQWLYRGDDAWLHLVQPPGTRDGPLRLGHIAFRTDAPAVCVLDRLHAADLAFEIEVVPETGCVQFFVSLPGGLVIELDAPA